jgi:predicted O-linked N-acetylglucosamine transferase (SPINDLY family)
MSNASTSPKRAKFDQIMALIRAGELATAQEAIAQARRVEPKELNLLNLAAWVASLLGEHNRAIALYRLVVAQAPGHQEAQFNLHRVEAIKAEDDGDIPAALAALVAAAKIAPGQMALLSQIALLRRQLGDFSPLPPLDWGQVPPADAMVLTDDPAQQAQAARAWAQRQFGAIAPLPPAQRRVASGKITLGFLSSDFHRHATAYLIAELFELLNRRDFAVRVYSYGIADASPVRQRIEQNCDAFIDLRGESAAAAAARLRADAVDIAIDLKGYTRGGRLDILAYRPAPVQLHWLGFPGTLGCDFIDYFVADHVVLPPTLTPHFSEQIIYLPDCYQSNDRQRPLPPPLPRAHYGLPDDAVVFSSFNQTYKMTPEMLRLWAEILRAVPRSVLWLLATNKFAPDNIRAFFIGQGIDAARVLFAEPCDLAEHLQRYHVVDVALDTFPVGGHTTTSDALWMGVPVVTLPGPCFVSRVAASLLIAVKLPELIAQDAAQYHAIAMALAQDSARRAQIKQYLTANRLNLLPFASESFVKNFAAGLKSVWVRYQQGLPPEQITVKPSKDLA